MGKKALIMTIGVGENTENGISFSIKKNSPDEATFFVTDESMGTLAAALNKLRDKPDFIINKILLSESEKDDFEVIYLKSVATIKGYERKSFNLDDITIDFTFGTKAMAAGLIAASIFKKIPNCCYIGGWRRNNGKVVTGSERYLLIEPRMIFDDYNSEEVGKLFNHYQFVAARLVLENISPVFFNNKFEDIKSYYNCFIDGYYFWDRFDYQKAFDNLNRVYKKIDFIKSIDKNKFLENYEFLKILPCEANSKHPKNLIIDIYENALRREEEGKYDDALIRIYRVMELISQSVLFEKHGINVSKVNEDKIRNFPEGIQNTCFSKSNKGENVTRGLSANFELLNYYGDKLGEKYKSDKEFQKKLGMRNTSILTHQFSPIPRGNFEALKEWVKIYVFEFFDGEDKFNEISNSAKMAKFMLN